TGGVRRRQTVVARGAAQGAVEAEGDGVDEGGLARTGGSLEEEEPAGGELVEVDLVVPGEGPDGLEAQVVDAHVRRSSRRRARPRRRRAARRSRPRWEPRRRPPGRTRPSPPAGPARR